MESYQELFEISFQQVMYDDERAEAFFMRFYENFIRSNDHVARKFAHTDLAQQVKMLKMSFDHMLRYANSLKDSPELKNIAEIHNRHNQDIAPELYDLWLDNILKTVEQLCPGADAETLVAWRSMLVPSIAYMKKHY